MATPTVDKIVKGNLVMHDHSEADLGAILDTRYLKLDGSNDPITGDITLNTGVKLDWGDSDYYITTTANHGTAELVLGFGGISAVGGLNFSANTGATGAGNWEPYFYMSTDGTSGLDNTTQGSSGNKKFTFNLTDGVHLSAGTKLILPATSRTYEIYSGSAGGDDRIIFRPQANSFKTGRYWFDSSDSGQSTGFSVAEGGTEVAFFGSNGSDTFDFETKIGYSLTFSTDGGTERMRIADSTGLITLKGSAVTITPSADSTSAFLVEKNDGTDVLRVDTTNRNLVINNSSAQSSQTSLYITSTHTSGDTSSAVFYAETSGDQPVFKLVSSGAANNQQIFRLEAQNASKKAFQTIVTGEGFGMYNVLVNGTMEWGPGGSGGRDTNLYRSTYDTLKTDDSFVVGNVFSQLGSGTSYFSSNLGVKTTNPGATLHVIGSYLLQDNTTPTKGYRYRTSGVALDFDFAAASMYFSHYQNADFSGTQTVNLILNSGGAVFNADGVDIDFRIESNNNSNMFFVDGGNDRVGIGTASPGSTFHVIGNYTVQDNTTPTKGYRFRTNGSALDLDFAGSALYLSHFANGDFSGTQSVVAVVQSFGFYVNDNAGDVDFVAKGDTDSNLFRVDAGLDRVAVGTSTFTGKFTVDQNSTSAGLPVIVLDQGDVSEEFIRFIGTSTTDATQSLVDASDLTTPGSIVGWFKIYVQDDQGTGPITDGVYYVPFYSAPTA